MTIARSFNEKLEAYAQLIIRAGCNLKEGQDLQISCAIDCADLARALTQTAYEQGAHRVWVKFYDEQISRMSYDYCPVEVFETFPAWTALQNNTLAREGCAILSITSEDPESLKGVDPAKLVAHARAAHDACKEFYDCLDFGRTVWCIVGAAAPAWARRVFPTLPEDQAMEHLWDAILHTARADGEDPLADWEAHKISFRSRMKLLNEYHFTQLHYSNARGTDFTVGLPDAHIWKGGGDETIDGTYFFPNIPTEEIFTTPDRRMAEGIVYAALPLVHNGSIISDFWLRFTKGKVSGFGAQEGYEVLKSILDTDDGANYLGEVALVPYTSPIRQTGILFYNTLFDENASCHLALGKGFPDCYEGGQEMTEESLLAAGVNTSATHVDFMIGTEDLRIEGIRTDGSVITIFEQGVWAF